MAEKVFGGDVPVIMHPILDHIQAKIEQDVTDLKRLIEEGLDSRNFELQVQILAEIHAGRRAIDVLMGKVTHLGETIGERILSMIPPRLKVDIEALSKSLGTPNPNVLTSATQPLSLPQ